MMMPTTTKTEPKARKRKRTIPLPQFWSYTEDRTKFRGQYIAIDGDRILAHGADARVVLATARKYSANPILEKVLPLRSFL